MNQKSEYNCKLKHVYPTRKVAKEAARKQRSYGQKKLHVYRCPHCDLFHLTKSNVGRVVR